MKRYFAFILFSLACKQGNDTVGTNKKTEFLTARSNYMQTHGDSLIFGFTKGTTDFDTSWTLLVSKFNNIIVGHINYLLPRRVTGFNDYIDESYALLHYNGFSFSTSYSNWDSLVTLSGIKNFSPTDTSSYYGCAHCPSYEVYYQSNIFVNSKGDRAFLAGLSRFFDEKLISTFFSKLNTPPILIDKRRDTHQQE